MSLYFKIWCNSRIWGNFCAAVEFSKKFKVFLPGNVVMFGILKQSKQEIFFLVYSCTQMHLHFMFFQFFGVQQWIVTLKGERKEENLNFKLDFRYEKVSQSVWKCGILNLLWKELSNGVWIIQIGRKLADADFQEIKWPLRPSRNIAKRR